MSASSVDVILAILRAVITLVERAFAGHPEDADKVLDLLPDGPLKTTVIAKFAQAQAEAKFTGRIP